MLTTYKRELEITDLLHGDIRLASPLNLYLELSQLVDDPAKSMSDIAQVIEKDTGLSARVLKIVNSAFFCFSGQISSITRAITLIGIRNIQNLVLTTLIIKRFSDMPGGLMSMNDFWSCSLRSGLIAKEFSQRENESNEAETAFICGLLHDIGLLVFYLRIPFLAREAGLMVQSNERDEINAERLVIGFDHYQFGAELCRMWKLPDIIVSTIQHHRRPFEAGEFAPTAAIVKLANQICKYRYIYPDCDLEPEWSLLGMPQKTAEMLIKQADRQFEAIYRSFFPEEFK